MAVELHKTVLIAFPVFITVSSKTCLGDEFPTMICHAPEWLESIRPCSKVTWMRTVSVVQMLLGES